MRIYIKSSDQIILRNTVYLGERCHSQQYNVTQRMILLLGRHMKWFHAAHLSPCTGKDAPRVTGPHAQRAPVLSIVKQKIMITGKLKGLKTLKYIYHFENM